MGCMARRNVDNVAVIPSNYHVMMAQEKKAGDKIGQPDLSGSCCCTCGEIGIIVAGSIPTGGVADRVDGAIATLKSGMGSVREINQIGVIAGTTAAVFGETVRKVGRTTGLTSGPYPEPAGRSTRPALDAYPAMAIG